MKLMAYIGIGSNLDDPVSQVREALEELDGIPDSVLVSQSSLYASKPMGPADQPALDEIAELTAKDDYKIQTLMKQVILSEPFLSKTNPKTETTVSKR